MLPKITDYAAIAFRHLSPEAREEAIQEAIANAVVAYARLIQLKKEDLAYPTVLARYAVAQIRDGRRVGNHLNIKDVLSEYAQKQKDFHVERLDRFNDEENTWKEAVVQDTRSAPVPEIVSFRVDFSEWLENLSRRDRRLAAILALNHRTTDVAKMFMLSPGRISQMRRELADSWKEFHGEAEPAA
jgi:hypothetical protein